MTTKEDFLIDQIKLTKIAHEAAIYQLHQLYDSIEHNTYDSIAQAVDKISDALTELANRDCEGSDKCGRSTYTRAFKVDDQLYNGQLSCEYNRHDKTYYYLESSHFTYEKHTSSVVKYIDYNQWKEEAQLIGWVHVVGALVVADCPDTEIRLAEWDPTAHSGWIDSSLI